MQMVDKVRWVVFVGINAVAMLLAYFYADTGNWPYWLGASLLFSASVVSMIRAEVPGAGAADSATADPNKEN
jgi:hypothetical protein